MKHKSMRDVKTFTNFSDQRRARTTHGAYIELAALALHRRRLVKEAQAAEARNAAIAERIQQMDRQSEILRSFIQNPVVLQAPVNAAAKGSPSSLQPVAQICERDFSY